MQTEVITAVHFERKLPTASLLRNLLFTNLQLIILKYERINVLFMVKKKKVKTLLGQVL